MTNAVAAPSTVRRFEGAEAAELATQAAVFEDLQYVLRCCEHLVTALAPPQPDTAFVEALWTGALVGYVRCFSGRQAVLTEADLKELQLDGDVTEFHDMIKKLRDHYASRHLNPRESFTIGVAQSNDGRPHGRRGGLDAASARRRHHGAAARPGRLRAVRPARRPHPEDAERRAGRGGQAQPDRPVEAAGGAPVRLTAARAGPVAQTSSARTADALLTTSISSVPSAASPSPAAGKA